MTATQKNSKVVLAAPTGRTWQNQRGEAMHVHNIQFENGDQGEYSSQSAAQTKFVHGQAADYTIEPGQPNGQGGTYPAKIKPVYNKGGGGRGGGSSFDPTTWAITQASNMVSAFVQTQVGMTKEDFFAAAKHIEPMAKAFLAVKERMKPAAAPAPAPAAQAPVAQVAQTPPPQPEKQHFPETGAPAAQGGGAPAPTEEDDLPF